MNSNLVEQVGQNIADGLSGVAGSMAAPISSAMIAAIGLGALILAGMLIWRVFRRNAR